jgi:hypothetical protein
MTIKVKGDIDLIPYRNFTASAVEATTTDGSIGKQVHEHKFRA